MSIAHEGAPEVFPRLVRSRRPIGKGNGHHADVNLPVSRCVLLEAVVGEIVASFRGIEYYGDGLLHFDGGDLVEPPALDAQGLEVVVGGEMGWDMFPQALARRFRVLRGLTQPGRVQSGTQDGSWRILGPGDDSVQLERMSREPESRFEMVYSVKTCSELWNSRR